MTLITYIILSITLLVSGVLSGPPELFGVTGKYMPCDYPVSSFPQFRSKYGVCCNIDKSNCKQVETPNWNDKTYCPNGVEGKDWSYYCCKGIDKQGKGTECIDWKVPKVRSYDAEKKADRCACYFPGVYDYEVVKHEFGDVKDPLFKGTLKVKSS